ncbi:MAG: hypothetical protein KME32_23820 [Mojavia pulchra JT2-VF2]|uniref:Uncharacterized protein n=1 Tax=Mojavia pulchra JT2-VF2 TaxID=287848 RepID=A0A951Q2I4_9NOST|nr:hypothetical protein [Mojavia pulchra JT2-VF2]
MFLFVPWKLDKSYCDRISFKERLISNGENAIAKLKPKPRVQGELIHTFLICI